MPATHAVPLGKVSRTQMAGAQGSQSRASSGRTGHAQGAAWSVLESTRVPDQVVDALPVPVSAPHPGEAGTTSAHFTAPCTGPPGHPRALTLCVFEAVIGASVLDFMPLAN